jgi:hypothetical protein
MRLIRIAYHGRRNAVAHQMDAQLLHYNIGGATPNMLKLLAHGLRIHQPISSLMVPVSPILEGRMLVPMLFAFISLRQIKKVIRAFQATVPLIVLISLTACQPNGETPPAQIQKGGGSGIDQYELILLPPLPGDIYAEARALNDADPVEIVGYSKALDGSSRAVKWTYQEENIHAEELFPLQGFAHAVANDINDNSIPVGYCVEPNTREWRPVVWSGNYPQDLYQLAGESLTEQRAEATSISNQGHVVGWYSFNRVGGDGVIQRPFDYYDGELDDWRSVPITNSALNAVTKAEGVTAAVGYRMAEDDPQTRSAIVAMPDASGAGSRHFFDEYVSEAHDVIVVEEDGYLVVGVFQSSGGNARACLWTGKISEDGYIAWEIRDLSAHPLGLHSCAFGINRNKVVVGSYGGVNPRLIRQMGDRSFIWSEVTGFMDLAERVTTGEIGDFELYMASDINEAGWIAGTGRFDGEVCGYLLVAEPGIHVEMEKLGPAEVQMTTILEYYFIIKNESSIPVEVDITDPLPEGTAYDEQLTPPWVLDNGILSRHVGLSAGERKVVPLKLKAVGNPGDVITNNNYAYIVEGQTPVVFDVPVQTVITDPPIEIEFSKAGPEQVMVNDVLEYVFTIHNRSVIPVSLTLSDRVPVGTAFDVNITPPWSPTDGIVTLAMQVDAQSTASQPLRLRVIGDPGQVITNNGYAYTVEGRSPSLMNIPVHTTIVYETPGPAFTADVECRVMERGETAMIDPDVSSYGGSIDYMTFYLGAEYLATDHDPPYSYEWTNVPAGIHPLRAVAYSQGQPVYEASPVILLASVVDTGIDCYEMVLLDHLEAHGSSAPIDNNDAGIIVGESRISGDRHPCKWLGAQPVELLDHIGWVKDITENGIIVGCHNLPEDENYSPSRPFMIHTDGRIDYMESLPEGIGPAVWARENGQVVLRYSLENTYYENGFIYQDGLFHQLLGPLPGYEYEVIPIAITRRGHVIGLYQYTGGGNTCLFIWQAPDHLSELQGEASMVQQLHPECIQVHTVPMIHAVNNTGYVVVEVDRNRLYRYNIEDISQQATYGELPITWHWYVRDMNDFTMIICNGWYGEGANQEYGAILHVCGHNIYVKPHVRGAYSDDFTISSINNNGEMVGHGYVHGLYRPFKLVPIR